MNGKATAVAGWLLVLLWHIWRSARSSLIWIVAVYGAAILFEAGLTLRRGRRRRNIAVATSRTMSPP